MKKIDEQRKELSKRQTELRRIMMSFEQHEKAMECFMRQHAMLHSEDMADSQHWSYPDELLNGMSEEQIRRIPRNCEHSVAWCIWHIARIEDVAMNMLVAGSPQVLRRENWPKRMKATVQHTGNAMDVAGVAELSAALDIEALRAYRVAVGRRTREIVQPLDVEALKQKVDPVRLQQVMDEGAVLTAAKGIVEYWSKRNIAGLLLMPSTRHILVHLNEALKLKERRR